MQRGAFHAQAAIVGWVLAVSFDGDELPVLQRGGNAAADAAVWTPLSQGHRLPGAVLISDLLQLVLFDAISRCDRYGQRPCTEPLLLVTGITANPAPTLR